MKPTGINKEKLKTVGLIILAVLIIGYGANNLYKKNNEKLGVKARTETLDTLIEMAKTCQAINIKGSKETLQIASINCIRKANGQAVIPVVVPEPVVEIVELEEE